MSKRDEILKRIREVPELPAAATKVSQIISQPDYNIKELEKAIEFDPAMTANVLKLANSAFFAGPRSISSIRSAIVRLGSKAIQKLVIATAVAPLASREVRGYDLGPGDLWEHSVIAAVAADRLANELGLQEQDSAFTGALLHDLGKFVLSGSLEVDAEPIMKRAFEEGVPFANAEQDILGIDHAEAGAVLLESWNMPAELVAAVRWHHEPDKCEKRMEVLDLVHIGNAIALMSGVGTGADELHFKPSIEVFHRLKIKTAIIEKVLNETMASMDELRQFFGFGSGGVTQNGH